MLLQVPKNEVGNGRSPKLGKLKVDCVSKIQGSSTRKGEYCWVVLEPQNSILFQWF